MTTDEQRERVLSECLAAYHRRRALGESPQAEDYRAQAGGAFDDLASILAVESQFDEALTPRAEAVFPRPYGAYTLLRELGRGAMGVVYEALHRPLGRRVALKVLRTGIDTDPVARERFRREARACAQVRHAHIVEVHDVGEIDGQLFYSMALLEGRSLADVVRRGDAPTATELCRRIADVADALHALHRAGIVHRDVKPSNIVVEADGTMVLADFGLARTAATGRLTSTGQALGTPLYMSPEQVVGTGHEIDGRADVYGLGATLYEVLAGRPAFAADEPAAILRRIVSERPPTLRAVAPSVDPACERIVMKSIEKLREDRYASAAEMRDDLRAFAEGRDVVGRPVSAARRGLRAAARRWPFAAVLLAIAGVSGAVWSHRPATLVVQTFPAGEVLVDGESCGSSPVRVALAPGRHEMSLRLPGFEELREPIDLSAGETRDVRQVLVVADPDDPDSIGRLAEALGVATAQIARVSGKRASLGSAGVSAVLPRGDVRREDLRSFRVETGEDFRDRGSLRLLRGTQELHAAPFVPTRLETDDPIPAVVLDALQPGDRVTWGFYPESGEPRIARFTVRASSGDAAAASLDDRLAGQHPAVLRQLRAQHFLADGLALAAYREAEAVVAERPGCELGWAVMLEALRRMGIEDSRLADRVRDGLDGVPEPLRGRAFSPR